MTDFIRREDAKTFIHDRAIEMALNNVGFKADASDILEHISQMSKGWIDEVPAADVVPVEWVPVKERLPEPCFPVWAACKAADGRENWVIETIYIPNPQSKSQWGPVPILETGRATVYAWAERHPPEAPKEG